MSGRVVLKRWVNGTNTRRYDPELLCFEGTVTAHMENGRCRFLERRDIKDLAETYLDCEAALLHGL